MMAKAWETYEDSRENPRKIKYRLSSSGWSVIKYEIVMVIMTQIKIIGASKIISAE
jgi:hypothetical protein